MADIKNVVFDFGNVLIKFSPKRMVAKYAQTQEDAELLQTVVFDRLYWDKLDSGDITDAEVVADCRRRLPDRLGDAAEQAYYNWIYNIPEIAGMRDVVISLKDRGIKLYLLSNISTYFAEHKDEISLLKLFDGLVLSGTIKKVKPSAAIFEHLCDTYGIEPEQSLFVDDMKANVDGAIAVGFNAYQFDGDVERFTEYLNTILK